ncbi:MAG: alpha,alpha-trehalose-phosphate synthase (UDP-forming) [Rhodospirillales bacterium]
MARLVIVSNRVAMPGEQAAKAGGLAVAVREALRKRGGIWFGWSGDIVENPSDEPRSVSGGRFTVSTIDLSPQEHETYYAGFSNSVLWPLFHYRLGLIDFKRESMAGYMAVNRRFAKAIAKLLQPDDIVWVHDYHFLPLGQALRELGVENSIGFFLHIPFPAPDVLIALPFHEQLVAAMCAYNLIGFQTERDARCFKHFIVDDTGGRVESDGTVHAYDRSTRVDVYPVGIETERYADVAAEGADGLDADRLRESLSGRGLIIGVDRLDYSKGLPLRFDAYSRLLAEHKEHRTNVVMMQIAPTSRGEVRQYRALRRELEQSAGRINGKYAEFDWVPLRYLNRSHSRNALAGFYRSAKVGLVTPLRDGMNLVAKEYVAAQNPDDPGVLVLSRLAGVAQELRSGAKLVNPYDIDGVAEALHEALVMELDERRARWKEMYEILRINTLTRWHQRFLADLGQKNIA